MDDEFGRYVQPSERLMRILEVVAAYIIVGLFALGLFDFVRQIVVLTLAGELQDPTAVVGLIDTVLLLFIIVEIFRTVVAYSREESVVRIVIIAAIIAVSRKIISFRPGDSPGTSELIFAATFAILLIALVIALYVVRTTEQDAAAEA